jgi:hypothetical protein
VVWFEIAEALAQIIANHAIDQKHTVGVHRRSENFAARKIAPFVTRDDSMVFSL